MIAPGMDNHGIRPGHGITVRLKEEEDLIARKQNGVTLDLSKVLVITVDHRPAICMTSTVDFASPS
ncbi:MAG: hypothetical protein ACM3S1_11260 [Hyphomicrobiales bacterium]